MTRIIIKIITLISGTAILANWFIHYFLCTSICCLLKVRFVSENGKWHDVNILWLINTFYSFQWLELENCCMASYWKTWDSTTVALNVLAVLCWITVIYLFQMTNWWYFFSFSPRKQALTLVTQNKWRCDAHFWLSANQIPWSKFLYKFTYWMANSADPD